MNYTNLCIIRTSSIDEAGQTIYWSFDGLSGAD